MNVFCGKKTARRKLVSIFIVFRSQTKQNELETTVTTFKNVLYMFQFYVVFVSLLSMTRCGCLCCEHSFPFQSFKLHTKDCANKYIFNTSRRKTLNKLQAMTLCLKTILYYLQTNISMKANNTIE